MPLSPRQVRRGSGLYTVGDVARVCRVNSHTARHWVERGQLRAYRLPGTNEWRLTRPWLEQFLREHEVPAEWLDEYDRSRAHTTGGD